MIFTAVAASCFSPYAAAATQAATTIPAPANEAGYYQNTFSTTAFSKTTTDLLGTNKSGFQWYLSDYFGRPASGNELTLQNNGNAILQGDPSGINAELVTAVPTKSGSFVGTLFGGGAYFDAVIKFNPKKVANGTVGWPAFWALAAEGNIYPGANQWPGQPSNYVHGIEVDVLEFMRSKSLVPTYWGTMHDWYGVLNKTCGKGLCQAPATSQYGVRPVPVGTDFAQFHHYGFLWVPATTASKGYARYYFDEQQIGPDFTWTQYDNQPPTPNNQPWAWSIIDKQHLFLILGTGPNQPMTVQSVNVYQANHSANLSQ